ncbi:MAG: 50S ribosomal protein L29 [Oscillospiraceae bacterium]|jgi:large subunit ribosomal protein L29|nr:50S ribosomal protein L29 [Oscillospiraceae bacterium]
MKPSEIRALSDKELVEKLDDLKSELFNLRFQHAINQLDNPLRIREVKRDIARTLTVIRAKELEAKNEREAE